jgi:hypothetical protein
VVRVANLASNFVTIPVAARGTTTCSDPGGLSASDLAAAQAGGLAIGEISLNRTTIKFAAGGISFDTSSDSATGIFEKFDFNSLIRSNGASGPSPGSCIVSLYKGQTDPGDPIKPVLLDAGPKLTLNGPGGGKDMAKADGIYSFGGTTPFLSPGTYTVSGPGGAHVGPFSASITIPTPLVWSNQSAITSVARSQDLRVTWTGGGASEQAIIFGASSDAASTTSGVFICYENASAGGFTVPSYVLSALPASGSTQGIGTGILQVGSYAVGPRFNATGLNYGVTTYTVINAGTVEYK